jgi:hypothetical protein
MPKSNHEKIVSCCSGGDIILTTIEESNSSNQAKFLCHGERTCYEIRTLVQDPFIFMSCGQDGKGCNLYFNTNQ